MPRFDEPDGLATPGVNRFDPDLLARRIPEFVLTTATDGRPKAIARYEITREMADHGCRSVLVADTYGELERLCTAERIKRGYVLAATRQAPTAQDRQYNADLFALDDGPVRNERG